MSNILHAPAADAIGETPGSHSGKSDKPFVPWRIPHWSTSIWSEKRIAPQIETRLSSVDRTLQAIAGLHRIIIQDERNAEWSGGTRERGDHGLMDCDLESLHNAMELLITEATSTMEELRERCDSAWANSQGAR